MISTHINDEQLCAPCVLRLIALSKIFMISIRTNASTPQRPLRASQLIALRKIQY